jgi:hypothetical protein
MNPALVAISVSFWLLLLLSGPDDLGLCMPLCSLEFSPLMQLATLLFGDSQMGDTA